MPKRSKKWEFWKYVWNNMKHHRTKTTWKHFKRHLFGEDYIYFTRSMGHDLTRMTATNAAWEDAKVWPKRHRKGPKSQLWHCLLVLSPTDLRWFTSEWYSMVTLLQSDCMILWWLKSNLVSYLWPIYPSISIENPHVRELNHLQHFASWLASW